jgi:hypothetical protein
MAFQQSSILGGLSLEYRRDIKKERSLDTDHALYQDLKSQRNIQIKTKLIEG